MSTGTHSREAVLKMSMDVKIDEFNNETIPKFAAATGRTTADVIRQQTKLLLRTLVKLTPPFLGLNDMAQSWSEQRKAGEGAVEHQIGNAFKAIDDLSIFKKATNGKLQEELQSAVMKQDTKALSIILERSHVGHVDPGDIITDVPDSLHNRLRNNRGRIPASKKAMYWVTKGSKLRAFINKKKGLVGKLKAGWAQACAKMGVSLPAWITRHGQSGGTLVDNSDDVLSPHIRMDNDVSYADAQDQDLRIVANAFGNQGAKMERQIEAKLAGNWSNAGGNK